MTSTLEPIVFLVDDEEVDRQHLARILSKSGLQVQQCINSQAFLDTFDAEQVGCVVIDVNLPGLNGPELHNILVERGSQMPVILVSGVATVSVATTAMRMGALDVLEKPVDEETFTATVKRGIEMSTKMKIRNNAAKKIKEEVETLTSEEREALPYICDGYSVKAVAAQLNIGFVVAARHQSSIFEKLNVCNAIGLVKRLEKTDIQTSVTADC